MHAVHEAVRTTRWLWVVNYNLIDNMADTANVKHLLIRNPDGCHDIAHYVLHEDHIDQSDNITIGPQNGTPYDYYFPVNDNPECGDCRHRMDDPDIEAWNPA